jgi:hypothetical protein
MLGPLAIRYDGVGLVKLPIGVLTTLLFGQLSHPHAGSPIKQLGPGAKLHNYQSSPVAQNYHCDSLKTCFSISKAAVGLRGSRIGVTVPAAGARDHHYIG